MAAPSSAISSSATLPSVAPEQGTELKICVNMFCEMVF